MNEHFHLSAGLSRGVTLLVAEQARLPALHVDDHMREVEVAARPLMIRLGRGLAGAGRAIAAFGDRMAGRPSAQPNPAPAF